MVKDPLTAAKASVDRFGATAMLQKRDALNGLPTANAPVDFDKGPFLTQGLGPSGEKVEYYNFDVQSTTPAPIYALFEDGATEPVKGQPNIIDVIPGDVGYNDFWQVVKVTVPKGYLANSITSFEEITQMGLKQTRTTDVVNCPVVPDGSTATKRLGTESTALTTGWYRGQVVKYFNFLEKKLTATDTGKIPTSPIFVTFKINPDKPMGGPGSGFLTETGSTQTHNVVASLPVSGNYSPLWSVNVYDNAGFVKVKNVASISETTVLANGVALVNCPVVKLP